MQPPPPKGAPNEPTAHHRARRSAEAPHRFAVTTSTAIVTLPDAAAGGRVETMTASDVDGGEGGGRCFRCTDANGGAPLSAAKVFALAIRLSICSGGLGEKQSRRGGKKNTTGARMILFATTQEAQSEALKPSGRKNDIYPTYRKHQRGLWDDHCGWNVGRGMPRI